jgi:hypothetical protein
MSSPEKINNTQESIAKINAEFCKKYGLVELPPDEVYELQCLEYQPMADCYSPSENKEQYLRSIIKAGEEYYGVVDIISRDPSDWKIQDRNMILTRHIPGERAQLVGLLNKPLTIGRDYQKNDSLKQTTSGKHFSIAQAADGSIGIIDHCSTNGTELFSIQPKNKFGFDGDKITGRSKSDYLNRHIDFWSAKSSQITEAINSKFEQ